MLQTKLHQICTKPKKIIEPDKINRYNFISLCIRFKLIYKVITQREQEQFRQVNELKNLKSLYYGRQLDHKKHL